MTIDTNKVMGNLGAAADFVAQIKHLRTYQLIGIKRKYQAAMYSGRRINLPALKKRINVIRNEIAHRLKFNKDIQIRVVDTKTKVANIIK